MIRSHESMAWHCCGTVWPKEYRYCGWCGSSVLTVDRVLLRLPVIGSSVNGDITRRGEIAVVASVQPDAESWDFLAKSVALSAGAFESRTAKHAAAPATTEAAAGSVVLAVDPSRSSPDEDGAT